MSYGESSSSSSFYQSGAGVNGFTDGTLFSQMLSDSSRNNHSLSSRISGGYGAALDGNFDGASQGSYSGYESTSSAGYGAGANNAFLAGGGGAGSEYYSSSTYGGVGGGFQGSNSYGASFEQQGATGASVGVDAGYNFSSSEQQSSAATVYATDAQGLFKDPNPQIIRRPAAGGTQTFTQRVVVRFLQPPPVPPPGVSRSTTDSLTQRVKCFFFSNHFSL